MRTDFNPPPEPPAPLRLRMERGRFRTGAGWIVPRFYSLFHAMDLVGTEAGLREFRRLLDRAVKARCNGIRVFGMLDWPTIKISPRMATYGRQREIVFRETSRRSLYVSWCLFCDAQRVMPEAAERTSCLDETLDWLRTQSHGILRLANEARKNGWSEADVLRNYPNLAHEDIVACLRYAAQVLRAEKVYPLATA